MPAQPAQWRTDPKRYFEEGEGEFAVASLREYKKNFTGHYFDKIAALSNAEPFQFTWSDVAAVNGLSVSVDASTAWNIVDEQGKLTERVNALLREIDPTLQLREASPRDLEPAYELWRLLQSQKGLKGDGVILSKLLAAKRPHLLPIRDLYVSNALFCQTKLDRHGAPKFDSKFDDWEAWRQQLSDDADGAHLSLSANIASADAEYSPAISVLRIIDIVVWMRHKGCFVRGGKVRRGLPLEFSIEPTFLGAVQFQADQLFGTSG